VELKIANLKKFSDSVRPDMEMRAKKLKAARNIMKTIRVSKVESY
jgi:hypothetical protein